MRPVIKFDDKAVRGQSTRLGVMICHICNKYKQHVVIPLNKKTMDKFEEHKNACSSLAALKAMDESLKTPAILERISDLEEVITLGYN